VTSPWIAVVIKYVKPKNDHSHPQDWQIVQPVAHD
jgi:hypothetical protein